AYPNVLSGGEKQRVAIMRAWMNEPKMILADEPTASLDAKRATEVMGMIRDNIRTNNSVGLMITHDERLFDYADRIYTLDDGHVGAEEKTEEKKLVHYLKIPGSSNELPGFVYQLRRTPSSCVLRPRFLEIFSSISLKYSGLSVSGMPNGGIISFILSFHSGKSSKPLLITSSISLTENEAAVFIRIEAEILRDLFINFVEVFGIVG